MGFRRGAQRLMDANGRCDHQIVDRILTCGRVPSLACSSSPTLLGAARFAGSALLWLISLNAGQQFFFQRSLQLPKQLSLHLETIEELDDLTVIVTKRVEACVSRH